MKKSLFVLLLIFSTFIMLLGCESEPETPKTIYDYSVAISESDYKIDGRTESLFVGNKIVVSKNALSEWEKKGVDSTVSVAIEAFAPYDAVPTLSEEYNKNYWLWYEYDYYEKERPGDYQIITTVEGETKKVTNEELRDQYKENMDELVEGFRKSNITDLENYIKQLGVECTANDKYVLAELDWEQLLTLLDTKFILIVVKDTLEIPA